MQLTQQQQQQQRNKDWIRMHKGGGVGCSSGVLGYLAKLLMNRNYSCFCADHDFDYRYGWKYGVSRSQADKYLREGIEASGHPKTALVVYGGVRTVGWMFYIKKRRIKGGE